MDIDIESLSSCPLCTNFKVAKSNNDPRKITELLKAHFISKHTSLLFSKFNEMHPEISTISPKVTSTSVHEGDEELDLYEVVEEKNNLLNKLHFLNLTDVQKHAIEQILNGDTTLVYKPDKYKCTKEQWEIEMESLRETISIYGYE
jgi:hypothetical protein